MEAGVFRIKEDRETDFQGWVRNARKKHRDNSGGRDTIPLETLPGPKTVGACGTFSGRL
jgi:hypothetical protein